MSAEDSDDEYPASFVHDESMRADNGSSISSVKQFFKNNRRGLIELLYGLVLIAALVVAALLFSSLRYQEAKHEVVIAEQTAKYEAVAALLAASQRELTDENRLRRNHDDQVSINLQAAQTVLALTRCKP